MPWRDGTGPFGEGPLTGRGLGPCGRGMGWKRGFGRGFGRGFARRRYLAGEPVFEPVVLTKEEQRKILEEEKKDLELEMKEIEKKLKGLK